MRIDKKIAIKAGVITALFSLIFFKRNTVMYGLITGDTLDKYIIDVCDFIGVNSSNAKLLLMETALAETNYGLTPDLTPNSDYGVFQFTQTGLNAVKRVSTERKNAVKQKYGIDIDTLTPAKLAYAPLASTICARLYYLTISEAIPNTLEKRAAYWKKYYNSSLGSGTINGYIMAVKGHEREKILKNIQGK
jgi:hypothetical protein